MSSLEVPVRFRHGDDDFQCAICSFSPGMYMSGTFLIPVSWSESVEYVIPRVRLAAIDLKRWTRRLALSRPTAWASSSVVLIPIMSRTRTCLKQGTAQNLRDDLLEFTVVQGVPPLVGLFRQSAVNLQRRGSCRRSPKCLGSNDRAMHGDNALQNRHLPSPMGHTCAKGWTIKHTPDCHLHVGGKADGT
jgi:hypothetical protein